MKITINAYNKHSGWRVVTTCPWCGHGGTFEQIGSDDISSGGLIIGMRRCPNPQCHGQLFFIAKEAQLYTYPQTKIDFDTKSIPNQIGDSLSQAIVCHSQGCYIAAAIMIRRTLEELCQAQNAVGKNLKSRLQTLKNTVILPQQMFDAMDELRLLGNDAAHIESHSYNTVGKEEVEIGIELTKEILKACYQLENLVDKLKALKKP